MILVHTIMSRRVVLVALAISSLGCTGRAARVAGKVEVDYRIIRYAESAGFIELGWEPLQGERPVAYVPSDRRWRAEMADWARDRRDGIMVEIKRETRHMNFRWEEYD